MAMRLLFPGHRSKSVFYVFRIIKIEKKQVRMNLDNEAIRNGLKLVPETYGMEVPSSCTFVMIAGENINLSL